MKFILWLLAILTFLFGEIEDGTLGLCITDTECEVLE